MGQPVPSSTYSTIEPNGKPAGSLEMVERVPRPESAMRVLASSGRERRGAVAWCCWKDLTSGSSGSAAMVLSVLGTLWPCCC